MASCGEVPVLAREHLLRYRRVVLVDQTVAVVVLAVQHILIDRSVPVVVRPGREPGPVAMRDPLVRGIDRVDGVQRRTELRLVCSGRHVGKIVGRDRSDPEARGVEVFPSPPSRPIGVYEVRVPDDPDVRDHQLEQPDVVIEHVRRRNRVEPRLLRQPESLPGRLRAAGGRCQNRAHRHGEEKD